MIYWGRSHPPYWCCWDGDQSLITSLMIWSMHLDLLARMMVLYSWIQWPRFMLCSAMVDFSGCWRWMCRWWSLLLVSVECPVCPMYTFPHLQGMLYMYDVFRARWSLMGQRKLENFLGGNPTVLILCFYRALLMQWHPCWLHLYGSLSSAGLVFMDLFCIYLSMHPW
jgi:hypothetical protein